MGIPGNSNIRRSIPSLTVTGTIFALTLLALVLPGCQGMSGGGDNANLVTPDMEQYDKTKQILDARDTMAKTTKVEPWQVKPEDLAKAPEIKSLAIPAAELESEVQRATGMGDTLKKPEPLQGYSKIDWKDKNKPVTQYASQHVPAEAMINQVPGQAQPKPIVETLGERMSKSEFRVFKINITTKTVVKPGEKAPAPQTNTVYFGPIPRADLDKIVAEAAKRSQSQEVKVEGDGFPVTFYGNAEGKVIAGIDDPKKEVQLGRIGNAIQLTYFKYPVEKFKTFLAASEKDPKSGMPPVQSIQVARIGGK